MAERILIQIRSLDERKSFSPRGEETNGDQATPSCIVIACTRRTLRVRCERTGELHCAHERKQHNMCARNQGRNPSQMPTTKASFCDFHLGYVAYLCWTSVACSASSSDTFSFPKTIGGAVSDWKLDYGVELEVFNHTVAPENQAYGAYLNHFWSAGGKGGVGQYIADRQVVRYYIDGVWFLGVTTGVRGSLLTRNLHGVYCRREGTEHRDGTCHGMRNWHWMEQSGLLPGGKYTILFGHTSFRKIIAHMLSSYL